MSKRTKKLYAKFGVFVFVVLFFTITPVCMALWDRLDPYVFSWPFAQFYVFLAAVIFIIGLNVVYRLENKILKEETAMRERGEKIDY